VDLNVYTVIKDVHNANVAPRRGSVDLNLTRTNILITTFCRSPQGERGFKFLREQKGMYVRRVAPRRGSVDLNFMPPTQTI